MAHKPFSKLSDYKLVHRSQNIVGHSMMDADGNEIGVVADLIVNTETNRVDTILLEDGTEYSSGDIDIDDKRAYLKSSPDAGRRDEGSPGASTPTGNATADHATSDQTAASDRNVSGYDDAHVQSRGDFSFSDYDEVYREHHGTTYQEGGDYATYEPAYRHGYEYGTGERYADRDYDALEPEMRKSYEKRHGEGSWQKVKQAARHSFRHARQKLSSSSDSSRT